jgi:thiol-disulfide isomerase/thioredoxin
VYPPDNNAGGYVDVGTTLPSWLSFQGYAAGSSTASTITSDDLFDCDGSHGINLVVVLQGAVYCEACQWEAQTLESDLQQYNGKGILVIDAVGSNADQSPATLATATQWKSQFGIQSAAVVADPNWDFSNPSETTIPITVVIDPRTMSVLEAYSGEMDPSDILQRAAQNAE